MNSYKLIIFDWDGTLMNSTNHIVECMQQAITKLSLTPLDDSAIRHIIGLGLNEAAHALYPDIEPHAITTLANEYRRIWLEKPPNSPLFNYAQELIN